MLAGVIAATMSTLDSTMNAISSCLISDFFRFIKYKKFTYLISFLLLTIVALISTESSGILELGLRVASWSAGFLLAMVTFGIYSKNHLSL